MFKCNNFHHPTLGVIASARNTRMLPPHNQSSIQLLLRSLTSHTLSMLRSLTCSVSSDSMDGYLSIDCILKLCPHLGKYTNLGWIITLWVEIICITESAFRLLAFPYRHDLIYNLHVCHPIKLSFIQIGKTAYKTPLNEHFFEFYHHYFSWTMPTHA